MDDEARRLKRTLDPEDAVHHDGRSVEAVAVAVIEGSREDVVAIKEGDVSPAQSNASSDTRSTYATMPRNMNGSCITTTEWVNVLM